MALSFEWDAAKARSNVAKHGVTFEMARDAFLDPFGVEFEDRRQRYDEDRWSRYAMVEGRGLVVTYAFRGESVRIISARIAEPFERRRYHEG